MMILLTVVISMSFQQFSMSKRGAQVNNVLKFVSRGAPDLGNTKRKCIIIIFLPKVEKQFFIPFLYHS